MFDLDFDNQNIFPFQDWEYNKSQCYSWVATAIVGGSVVAGLSTAYAANKASSAQTAAAGKASDTALQMYNTTRGDLSPYRAVGVDATNKLGARLDDLTAPINLTEDWLESTPGYQFTKRQGIKAAENSAAFRGLGVSGAALKGVTNFVTGLADNTYKTQFDVANTNKTNAFNRLKALVDTGENASAQTGTAGTSAANTAAGAAIGAGNAQAAASNTTGGAIANVGNNIAGYSMFKGLYGNNNSNSGGSPGNYAGSPETNANLNPAAYGNI
jgi:hypothetical protein